MWNGQHHCWRRQRGIKQFFWCMAAALLLLLMGCAPTAPRMQYIAAMQHVPGPPLKPLKAGLNTRAFHDGQLVYIYVSQKALANPKQARLLASIHSWSGRFNTASGRAVVRQYMSRWQHLADQHGWVVVSPHFDEERFNNDYQRLNPFGIRTDLRLNAICEVVGQMLPGLPTEKIMLFGFSGSGQFVHRYAAVHPHRVERAVAASGLYYMWPDTMLPYPVGLDTSAVPGALTPQLRELCQLPLLILVGDHDRDTRIRRLRSGYDLVRLQGVGRRERAKNWVAAIRALATKEGWPCRLAIRIIPNTAHRISDEMFQAAASFLFVNQN